MLVVYDCIDGYENLHCLYGILFLFLDSQVMVSMKQPSDLVIKLFLCTSLFLVILQDQGCTLSHARTPVAVEMMPSVFGKRVHGPGWHVHILPKRNHAGQTLHIEIGHK